MHSKEAHTAEHIFVGSIQKLAKEISVRKVEHTDTTNRLYLRCSDLNLDIVYQAEVMTNQIIEEGRQVKEHNFHSIEEARRRFPYMRANEERISGDVRVIEVDGYDYSACARDHAQSTNECGFFLVSKISREGEEYEVEFLTGKDAQKAALELSMKCIKVGREIGANMHTLEAAAKNMKSDLENYKKKISTLTENLIGNIQPTNKNGMMIHSTITHSLDDVTVARKAGEIIKKENAVVLITNMNSRATILLACSEHLQFDCSAILRSVLGKFGGKGGGKRNFATGSVESEKAEVAHADLYKELNG